MSTIEGVTEDLQKELVKLADLLESCEIGSPEYKQYARDYRRIVRALYPKKRRNKSTNVK